tara:strand:+ start:99 stop:1052 length:954 start_codon:yes stop_codon:yes gene_type:complete
MDKINVTVDEGNIRIDQFLVNTYPKLSRSKIQHLIKTEHIKVDGLAIKPSLKLKGGELVSGEIIEVGSENIIPEQIDLDIVYEDEDIIVINKPSGLVVHPGNGNFSGTLVNGLVYHFNNLSDKDASRPGIIHRLDKDTTGILVVAKNNHAHDFISEQFANRKIYKEYEAIAWGEVSKEGVVEGLIGRDKNNRVLFNMVENNGKTSKSSYFLKGYYAPLSHVKLIPYTGRTHQLRVHMKSIGHPIFCDELYNGGKKNIKSFESSYSLQLTKAMKNINRVALHAKKIELRLPSTNNKIAFEVDLPDDMKSVLDIVNNDK